MAQRKTFKVEELKKRVNSWLASEYSTPQERRGAYAVLESILMETGNYKGFGYLPSETDGQGRLKNDHDDTRRRYF